jgi:hypothetical protein
MTNEQNFMLPALEKYNITKRRPSQQQLFKKETKQATANATHTLLSTYTLWYTEFLLTKSVGQIFYSPARKSFVNTTGYSAVTAESFTSPKGNPDNSVIYG